MRQLFRLGTVVVLAVCIGCAFTARRTANIAVAKDQSVSVNGQSVKTTEIAQKLTELGFTRDTPIVIRAHREVPYKAVMDVFNQLKQAGCVAISFAPEE